jgi:protein phosphatase 1 regulatory subunit 7
MLDVGNNKIRKLENVNHLTKLEEFWGNHNDGFDSLAVIEQQLGGSGRDNSSLKTVYFEGCPIASDPQYRLKLKLALPSLQKIDATYIAIN